MNILDAIYGRTTFDASFSKLAASPVVQRLRHVRLSNIESLDAPGAANISRYEHVIGVAYLASQVGFSRKMSQRDRKPLQASAMLHDWAITSFGHLVEEALQYVGTGFHHEARLNEILAGEAEEIGGIERQILVGRATGLREWAISEIGHEGTPAFLKDLTDTIQGRGPIGPVIAGSVDLDNIDNVCRMAFHMGLDVDKALPVQLAKSMLGVQNGHILFDITAEQHLSTWVDLRSEVYSHLMMAPDDFIGKVMLLNSAITAFEHNEFGVSDWSWTDHQFLGALLSSPTPIVKETAERWLSGELWACTPMWWFEGPRPPYVKLREFSRVLSERIGRDCLAYAIKDKRHRSIEAYFSNGSIKTLGSKPNQWLLGVGSPLRRDFTNVENHQIQSISAQFFDTRLAMQPPISVWSTPRAAGQGSLF